jgi:hypothetical protein
MSPSPAFRHWHALVVASHRDAGICRGHLEEIDRPCCKRAIARFLAAYDAEQLLAAEDLVFYDAFMAHRFRVVEMIERYNQGS